MSISPTVDANYRLHAADLEGIARRVIIANVTYQGVEEMTPVLHFIGQSKRLVLSPDQVGQLVDVTGTTLFRQWIGLPIILQPHTTKQESLIRLKAVGPNQHAQPMPVYVPDDRRGWYLALIVVGLLLATSAIYAALNFTTILTAAQQLRDYWPLR
jgi:hypothetical protein